MSSSKGKKQGASGLCLDSGALEHCYRFLKPVSTTHSKSEFSGAPFGADRDQVPEEANQDVSLGHCPRCGGTLERKVVL